jgi:sugar phosphate isomerase/epimerase
VRLSCGTDSFPMVPHEVSVELIRRMGFDGHDLMVAGNRGDGPANGTKLQLEEMVADPERCAGVMDERVRGRGLEISDLFASPWTDFHTMGMNNPDPGEQAAAWALFEKVLALAIALRAPGITMPPGVDYPGESHAESLARSAAQMRRRAELARSHGIRFSTEPHVGSVIERPADVLELCHAADGLVELTLDYSHFLTLGFEEADVHPLLEFTRHFHARGTRDGRMQAPMSESTLDVEGIVDRLAARGYDGFLTVEYVWVDWGGMDEIDVISETVLMRDRLRAKLADLAPA